MTKKNLLYLTVLGSITFGAVGVILAVLTITDRSRDKPVVIEETEAPTELASEEPVTETLPTEEEVPTEVLSTEESSEYDFWEDPNLTLGEKLGMEYESTDWDNWVDQSIDGPEVLPADYWDGIYDLLPQENAVVSEIPIELETFRIDYPDYDGELWQAWKLVEQYLTDNNITVETVERFYLNTLDVHLNSGSDYEIAVNGVKYRCTLKDGIGYIKIVTWE